MAKRKLEYKPLLFTTTVRNPTRIKSLLYVLQKYDVKVLIDDLAEEIMCELIKYGLYRPMNSTKSIKTKLQGTKKGEFRHPEVACFLPVLFLFFSLHHFRNT
jgi:hypothetical protein